MTVIVTGPWLSAIAVYQGQRCPVWIDLRRIIGVVYRPSSGELYLEGDSAGYEIMCSSLDGAARVAEWVREATR